MIYPMFPLSVIVTLTLDFKITGYFHRMAQKVRSLRLFTSLKRFVSFLANCRNVFFPDAPVYFIVRCRSAPKTGSSSALGGVFWTMFHAGCRGCRFGVAVTLWTRLTSYSTLGPVSAWVGDRLWTGKPPRRRTRHPGLLSLNPPSVAGWDEYPVKAGRVSRHIA